MAAVVMAVMAVVAAAICGDKRRCVVVTAAVAAGMCGDTRWCVVVLWSSSFVIACWWRVAIVDGQTGHLDART